jgi:PAS domain S-box-containing protein
MSVRDHEQNDAAGARLDGRMDEPASLQAILGGVADGVTAQDPSGAVIYANDAAARLVGFDSAEEFLSTPVTDVLARFEILDEQRRPLPLEELPGRTALRGEITERTLCYRIRRTGEERWSIVSSRPVFGSDGAVQLAVNTIHDVTDRMRAGEHVRLLGETSALLAASLNFEDTLARVGDLLVPAVADYCIVDLVGEAGRLRQALLRHAEPGQEELLREIRRRFPPEANPRHPATQVLASGEPLLIEHADDAVLEDAALDSEHLRLYHELQPSSYVVVPCVARGRTIGALSLGTGSSGRRFARQDVAFARVVGGRIALASENARLYTEASESYAQLDTLLLSAPVGIGFWDRELRFVRLNDALAELNGLPVDDHIGKTLAEVIPHLAPSLEPLYRRVLETGEPLTHEEALGDPALASGSRRHWISSYYPVRSESDEITGVGAVIMEVTAQRRADERLQLLAEAGSLFSSSLDRAEIFERVARVVVPRFAESCSIYLSEGESLQRVGYAHADPRVEPLVASLPSSYPLGEGSTALMARAFSRGKPLLVATVTSEFVDNLETLGVDRRTFEEIGTQSMMFVPLVARGEGLGVMTIGSRVAGRFDEADLGLAEELGRRAAVAIDNARLYTEAEARAQASQALQFVRDGVFLLDGEQVIQLWNPAAERITGLREEDVRGRPAAEALASWPLEQVGERGQTLPIEIGDRELWLSLTAAEFQQGTVYAFRDLTEERALERLKSDFVSTVSHELRTPLAAIYGAAMTLRRRDVPLTSEQREGMLGVVAGESERLARIVNDILYASRLDSDAVDVSIAQVSAGDVASAVVTAAKAHLPDGIELSLDVGDELPPVAADADKVRQVLVNLVENAIKYSPDGGSVRVLVELVENRVRFSVSDRGLGIPAVEQGRIFEKFYRLDPDLTRGVGGTGLGLYISREIVRRMDGRIWVESVPGEGSTFSFELPLAA